MNAFAARAAWRRRVARTGSLIQLAFALLWIGRATLAAAGLPGRIPVGAILAAAVAVVLLWLRVTLASPGHLMAGIGLVAVPGALVLVLAGPSLIVAASLAAAALLVASAVTGLRALASGRLGAPPPRADERIRVAA